MAPLKQVELKLPASTEDLRKLEIGTVVYLTGRVYTAREGVYKRAVEDGAGMPAANVDLGTGDAEGPQAGFLDCSPIGAVIDVIEYRNGNDKENALRKLTGLTRYPDVTLKRGIIGATDLYAWLDAVRNGAQNALRTVTVRLMSEDHSAVVQTWKLLRARPVRYAAGGFDARRSDVALEELTLAYERLELE